MAPFLAPPDFRYLRWMKFCISPLLDSQANLSPALHRLLFPATDTCPSPSGMIIWQKIENSWSSGVEATMRELSEQGVTETPDSPS